MTTIEILIVEDEIGIANFMIQGLEEEGFSLTHCMSMEEALVEIRQKRFQLILLDWMILDSTGLDLCKYIRQNENINQEAPIIFITAKDTVQDTIEGLNAGANDYIKKPFNFDELIARINVHLRMYQQKEIKIGNITINLDTHQTFLNGALVDLTLKEFELLHLLFHNKNRICQRKEILEKIWDIHFEYDSSVIDVFINSIRKKLNLDKKDPRLTTIRGVGYITKDA